MQQRIFDVSFCGDYYDLYYHYFSRVFAQKLVCMHWGKEGFMSRKKTLKWLSQRWATSKFYVLIQLMIRKQPFCVRINVLETTHYSQPCFHASLWLSGRALIFWYSNRASNNNWSSDIGRTKFRHVPPKPNCGHYFYIRKTSFVQSRT